MKGKTKKEHYCHASVAMVKTSVAAGSSLLMVVGLIKEFVC